MNEKENILGFSITIAAFYITVLYNLYNYSAESILSVNLSLIISFVEAILFSSLVLLGFSIFSKGYSLGLDGKNKDIANRLSFYLYTANFRLIIYSLPMSVFFYLSRNCEYRFALYIIISLVIVAGIVYPFFKNKSEDVKTTAFFALFLLMVGLIIYAITFSAFIDIRPNNIDIEMDNFYEKDDTLMQVSATLTGVNNDLYVGLFQENESNDLNLIEELKIPVNTSNRKVEYGPNYLLGNSLNNGNYIIFINTTLLQAGYYELWFNVAGTSNKDSKGFILNDIEKKEADLHNNS